MKKVTILSGIVDAVYLCEPPDGVETVEAPDEVFPGWRYEGSVFYPPPVIAPEPTLADKLAALDEKLSVDLKGLASSFLEAQFIEGSSGESRMAALRSQRDARLQVYNEDLEALLLEAM